MIVEQLDLKQGKTYKEIKKKHWIDFYHYMMVVYRHCQHTFTTINFKKWFKYKFKYLSIKYKSLQV